MTDDPKDNELDEEASISAEPDFSPSVASPILDDDATDDDPHASFNPAVAIDDSLAADPYGVGAPKMGQDDYEEEEDLEDEVDESVDASSDAY